VRRLKGKQKLMMKVTLTAAFVVAAALGSPANAAAVVHPGAPGAIAAMGGIEFAQYRHHYGPGPVVVRPGIVRPVPRPYYRRWVRRPYFGTVIAGVALGTILTAAAIGAPPPPPAPNLCWYWADPSLTRGYWDYCR
jgi:hypothetical protein